MPRARLPSELTPLEEFFAGWPARGGGARAAAHRAAMIRLLWLKSGRRRLPTERAFDAAAARLRPGDLEAICEENPLAPIYLVPTRRWLRVLAEAIRATGARRVVEVAAGDGFLARSLGAIAPDLEITATDSGAWERPRARMNAAERKRFAKANLAGVALGEGVLRLEAREAVRRLKPDLVLCSWLPPGPLLDRIIRSPVRHVLEIGAAGGVTAGAWSWRFNHDFLTGPVESLARCRLDERPGRALHSRVTLYEGAASPDFHLERVKPGDWLWQFRPRPRWRS